MGGIIGLVSLSQEPIPSAFEVLRRMAGALGHRGRLLRITASKKWECQPFTLSVEGTENQEPACVWAMATLAPKMQSLALNGSISLHGSLYNQKALTQSLDLAPDVEAGHLFCEGYARKALRFLPEIQGDFAVAVHDIRASRIVCARDRFGAKPLVYSLIPAKGGYPDALLFASEPRALFASGLLNRQVSEPAAQEYMGNGMGRGGSFGTIYEKIEELRPGHALFAAAHGIRLERWYELEPRERMQEKDVLHELREVFLEAIRIRLPDNRDIFTPVSGGLDSNSILGALAELRDASELCAKLHGIHLALPASEEDESQTARSVAKSLAVEYHEGSLPAVISPRHFVEYILTVQGPVDALQHINQRYFYALASKWGADSLMAGEYGDTFSAGLAKHYLPLLISATQELKPLKLLRLAANIPRHACRPVKTLCMAGAADASLRYRRRSARMAIRPYWRPRSIPDCVAWRSNLGLCGWPEYCRRTVDGWRLWDTKELEAVASASGLEWRTPFLDHRIVELLIGQDPFLIIKDGWSKYLLRRQAERWLPAEICWKKEKRGLYVDEDQVFPGLRRLALSLSERSGVIPRCVDLGRIRKNVSHVPSEVAWRCLNVAVLELDRDALTGLPDEL